MRTSAVFLAALIALALAPLAFSAGHEHKAPAPAHGHHHDGDTAVPHDSGTSTHGHTPHVTPHEHNLLQRLHYVAFGRYHRVGTCASHHQAPPPSHHNPHDGHGDHDPHGH